MPSPYDWMHRRFLDGMESARSGLDMADYYLRQVRINLSEHIIPLLTDPTFNDKVEDSDRLYLFNLLRDLGLVEARIEEGRNELRQAKCDVWNDERYKTAGLHRMEHEYAAAFGDDAPEPKSLNEMRLDRNLLLGMIREFLDGKITADDLRLMTKPMQILPDPEDLESHR